MPFTLPAAPYIGRFAPSPTGPLHSGSLVAALASFLDARSQQGKWLVRIENIDPPREQSGASHEILKALEAHQLLWDGSVIYQSDRFELYRDTANSLIDQNLAYFCTCSRSELKGQSIYPGTCRNCQKKPSSPAAVRVICQPVAIDFEDRIQGPQHQQMDSDIGDFVIYRKDHLPAYQLATAVDDVEQNISHVVRGCDLLDSTPRQLYLQQLLQKESPSYAHLPVLAKADGQKLSKQNLAAPLNLSTCNHNLIKALTLLNQNPPVELTGASCAETLDWATLNWHLQNIPSLESIRQDQPDF
jgi:glutamyl-Q tRNA(Asp) synthetase